MCRKLFHLTVLLLLFGINTAVHSQTYVFGGAPGYWSGNGHYYQVASVDAPWPSSFTVDDIETWLSSHSYLNYVAHLATYNSEAELNALYSDKGLVGATGDNSANGYTWSDQTPVQIYGTFHPSTFMTCGLNSRLIIINREWYGFPNRIACRYPNGGTSPLRFSIEYEPLNINSVAPQGPYSVGDQIVIMGSGFVTGSIPFINNIVAEPFTRLGMNAILATVPEISDGQFILRIQAPSGISSVFSPVVGNEDVNWSEIKAMYK